MQNDTSSPLESGAWSSLAAYCVGELICYFSATVVVCSADVGGARKVRGPWVG